MIVVSCISKIRVAFRVVFGFFIAGFLRKRNNNMTPSDDFRLIKGFFVSRFFFALLQKTLFVYSYAVSVYLLVCLKIASAQDLSRQMYVIISVPQRRRLAVASAPTRQDTYRTYTQLAINAGTLPDVSKPPPPRIVPPVLCIVPPLPRIVPPLLHASALVTRYLFLTEMFIHLYQYESVGQQLRVKLRPIVASK